MTTTSAALTTTEPHPNSAEAGLTERQKNRIPGYKVFEQTKSLPEVQMLAIRWLHGHYWDSGLSLQEIGTSIGYDGGTVSKVFHGKYQGDLAAVTHGIVRYRKLCEERASVNRAPYIKTELYKEIEECCQIGLTYQKPVFIYGESQIGKTAALKQYAKDHNHGETIYVEVPPGGALSAFVAEVASAVRFTGTERGEIPMLKIMRSFGSGNLLIVDEAQRLLQARSYGGNQYKTLDFIRAIMDRANCGGVLCGSNQFRDDMKDNGSREKFLNQLNRRCILRRQLSSMPSEKDLNTHAAHYRLPPAQGVALQLQSSIIANAGIGVWLSTLTMADRKATKEGKRMTWDHVINAHAFLRQMESPTPTPNQKAA